MHENQVDLSKATYSADLSSTDLDAETLRFHATMDRVVFKKPLEIVTRVLEANGYVINLENLLGCLDHFTLGAKVKLGDKFQPEQVAVPRNFMPCIQFELPNKSKKGFLLKQFYAEIESYEQEIARLQDGDGAKAGEKAKSREQLRRDIERLLADNSKLRSEVNDLTQKLSEAIKIQVTATRALESHNIIPPQLRMANVREISLRDRTLLLKSGRTNIPLPMILLQSLPEIGDPCLVHIADGKTIGAFFYHKPGRAFATEIAEVLFAGEGFCKVRDGRRKIFNLTPQNDLEQSILKNMRRGEKIMIHSIDGYMIRFEELTMPVEAHFAESVQEKIAMHQLEQVEEARVASESKAPRGKEREEG